MAQHVWQAELDRAVAARGEPVRALFEAARADRVEEVRSLVTAGADLDTRTVENQWPYTPAGDTPLIQAVKAGAATTAQVLVGLGADLAAANDFGQTALHRAVTNRYPALVESLIGAGAEVNPAEQHYGWTPLHRAALTGDAGIVDTLLAAGADPEAVLVDGRTPADCAHTNGHTGVIARLART